MESKMQGHGHDNFGTRDVERPRRITAQEIALGVRRPEAPALGRRTKGVTPGTYRVACDLCQGRGHLQIAQNPFTVCMKCGGDGALEVHGTREYDGEKRFHAARAKNRVMLWLSIACLGLSVGLLYVYLHLNR